MALVTFGCKPGGSTATVSVEDAATKAPDPTGASESEEAIAENYPDRVTPYDRYLEDAHLRLGLRVHDPASLSKMWSAFSRAYGVAALDMNTLVREGLYSAGVPGEVLESVDPSSSWALEIDYPLRAFSGLSWVYVPALPDKAAALADAVANWLDMEEVESGFWHAPPVEVEGVEPDIAYESLPDDQKGDGSYLGQKTDGVVLGFRAAAARADRKVERDPASRLALLELEGFASAVPDLLEEFDFTMHHDDREQWASTLAKLSRAYLSIDRIERGPALDIELGLDGELTPLDPGWLGPARDKPASVAKLLPAGAFVGLTMSWGDPTTIGETLRAGTRGPTSAALEREFGDWSDALVDHVAEDAALAAYVDDKGRHNFVVALPGMSERGMKEAASTLMTLADRTLRSLDAALVAKEAAKEITTEEFEAQRLPHKKVQYKRRGGKVEAIEVTLTESLRDEVKFLADDEGTFVFSAFEYRGAFIFTMGPGSEGFISKLGGGKTMAKEPGLLAAHERSAGCQVCGFVNGSRGAASTYGRHRRGMTAERRKEAERLLPKLKHSAQNPLALRVEPGKLRLTYLLDMSVIAAGKSREEAWEAFMKAIGARGDSVSDPREWLFG